MIRKFKYILLAITLISCIASAATLAASSWKKGTANGSDIYFGPGYQTRTSAQNGQAIWTQALSGNGGGALVKTNVTIPTVAGDLKAAVTGLATAVSVYEAFALIAGGPVGVAAAALVVAPAVIDWLASGNARATVQPDGTVAYEKLTQGCTGTCYEYSKTGYDGWKPTQGEACNTPAPKNIPSAGVWVKQTISAGSVDLSCRYVMEYQNCTNCSQYNSDTEGVQLSKRLIPQTSGTWNPTTLPELKPLLSAVPVASAMIDKLLDSGASIPISYAPGSGFVPVDGPVSVTGSPTVVKSSDGTNTSTTNTTPSADVRYGTGPDPDTGATVPTVTVTAGEKSTTTVTKNADGSIVSTTTKDTTTPTKPDTPPVPDPATDTPLGDQPKLYTPKYPRGLEGVWSDQKDALKNTPLARLAPNLMPTVASGGTCPSMPVNLTFSTWASFGVHDVAPPCVVWDWGKAIIILSALLLARALVFGG